MKTKRLSAIFSATIIGVSSILSAGLVPLAGATANNCTWTGASSLNFNTAGNWSNCNSTVPQAGDNLVFDSTSLTAAKTLNNDITNLSVGTITFSGTNSGYYGFTLGGNGLTVGSAISNTGSIGGKILADVTLGGDTAITTGTSYINFNNTSTAETIHLGGHTLTVNGDISTGAVSGTGNITLTGTNSEVEFQGDNSDWTSGTLTENGTSSVAVEGSKSLGSANVVIPDGGYIDLCGFNGASISNPLTIGGRGASYTSGNTTTYTGAVVLTSQCGGGGGGASDVSLDPQASANWTGPITLTSNTTVSGQGELTVSGALHGNYTLTQESGTSGKITLNSSDNQSATSNGTQTSTTVTTTYSDNQPNTGVYAEPNTVAVVDGTYGDAFVSNTGTLKGTGTVNSIQAAKGGVVAPGHSPGKLTVKTTLQLNNGAIYQAELKDTADGDFDQLVVGAATDTDNTSPDVTLGDTNGSPTLTVSLYDGYKINKGDQFMIINNLSKTDVKGTFANLPEGATFKVGDAVFAITYKGGDGNDVVLTAQNTPSTPDTGFGMAAAHPSVTLGLTVLVAGGILIIARRSRLAPAKARATSTRRRK